MITETETLAEMAAHDFEAWMPGGDGLTPVTLRKDAPDHINYASVAVAYMYYSKPNLTALAAADGETFMDMADRILDSAEALEEVVRIMRAATGRMLVASASAHDGLASSA